MSDPDEEIDEIASAFQAEHDYGILLENEGGAREGDTLVQNHPSEAGFGSAEEGIENDLQSSLRLIVMISGTLLTTFSIAVVIVWLLYSQNGLTFGGPPQALLTWEDEYRELTGIEDLGLNGDGVTLCVVDSGIDMSHPDLENVALKGWYDAVNSLDSPYDDEGHGTAMAGIIVADGGLNGVAKNVELLVAKAISSQGTGDNSDIADSVDWCVQQGSDIISLSLGGEQNLGSGFVATDDLEQSVENALNQGIFVVAAAGNDGEDDDGDVSSPGSVEDVICVGGVTRLGSLWSGSSEGDNNGRVWPNPILPRNDPDKKPEVVAPSHEVPILMVGQQKGAWWGWSSGTSAATAWVSGGLALYLEANPELQHDGELGGSSAISQVKQLLSENSQMKEGQSSHDDHFGYGILRIDLLLDDTQNESDSQKQDVLTISIEEEAKILSNQAERRRIANVPPVNSTKPRV